MSARTVGLTAGEMIGSAIRRVHPGLFGWDPRRGTRRGLDFIENGVSAAVREVVFKESKLTKEVETTGLGAKATYTGQLRGFRRGERALWGTAVDQNLPRARIFPDKADFLRGRQVVDPGGAEMV